MKAVSFDQTGDASVLKYKSDVPIPVIEEPHQILIRNKCVGVNYIDTYHRSGLYKVDLPCIPGREGAGVIQEVGSGVKDFKKGDRVAYFGMGTYAEVTRLDTGFLVHLSNNIPFDVGAAMLIQGMTALTLTKLAYSIQKGDTVLIHAAAGGTGLLLVQLAKHFGATVIGTTSTPVKAQMAKEAGADHVIFYAQEDIVQAVAKLTNGKGVQAVYDGVGKSTFDASLACLSRLGSMVSFGNASGKVDDVPIMKLVPRAIRLMRPSLFEFVKSQEDFDDLSKELMDLVNAQKLKFHVHKVYPLENAAEAHRDLESRQTQGKLVLSVD